MNTQFCDNFLRQLLADVHVCGHFPHQWPPMQDVGRNISCQNVPPVENSKDENFRRYFQYVSKCIKFLHLLICLFVSKMLREASYRWSFHPHFFLFFVNFKFTLSPVFFSQNKIFRAKLRNFESNQCRQIEKKTAKISEERKFGRSAFLFLRHEE